MCRLGEHEFFIRILHQTARIGNDPRRFAAPIRQAIEGPGLLRLFPAARIDELVKAQP